MPDVSGLGKDELASLCSKLYEQSCAIFGEKFIMEQQVENCLTTTLLCRDEQRLTSKLKFAESAKKRYLTSVRLCIKYLFICGLLGKEA